MLEIHPSHKITRKVIPIYEWKEGALVKTSTYENYTDIGPVVMENENSPVIHASTMWGNNYYHLMHDVLSGWAMAMAKAPELVMGKTLKLQHGAACHSVMRELIEMFDLKVEVSEVEKPAEGEAFFRFREHYSGLTRLETSRAWRKLIAHDGQQEWPRHILVQRGLGGTGADQSRNIQNRHELMEFFRKQGRPLAMVFLEEIPIRQQMDMFENAELVVGVHGAGLTNLMFCHADCQVIEIRHPTFHNSPYEDIGSLFHLQMAEFKTDLEYPPKDFQKAFPVDPRALWEVYRTL